MLKRIIVLVLIIFAFKGCTKDDICPAGEATTPNLVITFNDITKRDKRKKVALTVKTDNIDSLEIIALTNTDSIVLPLNTNLDNTKYLLIKSIISETGNVTEEIIDKLVFTYNQENIYVNRACGFKTEFTNLDADFENGGPGNWIKEIEVKRNTINDENSAHVTLLH